MKENKKVEVAEEIESATSSNYEERAPNSYAPFLALASPEIAIMNEVIATYKTCRFEPRKINIETFREEYLANRKASECLAYLVGLDQECITGFIALINFAQAGVKLQSKLPVWDNDSIDMVFNVPFSSVCNGDEEEFFIQVDADLSQFMKDYMLGNIITNFTAYDLLFYLSEEND